MRTKTIIYKNEFENYGKRSGTIILYLHVLHFLHIYDEKIMERFFDKEDDIIIRVQSTYTFGTM